MRGFLLAAAIAALPVAANAQVQGDTVLLNPSGSASALYSDGNYGALVQGGFSPRSSATGGNATGGTATGGNAAGGVGYGGAGGTGGNASVGAGSGSLSVGGAGIGNTTWRQSAASAIAPSIGGGGFDCPTVGFGAAGQALGGGGGFGPSWLSTQCDRRKKAELLTALGRPDAALALMRDNDDEVRRALAVADKSRPQVPQPTVFTLADYCKRGGWTRKQIVRRYPECRGAQ